MNPQFLDEFLVYIRSEKGLARNTVESYERDIRKLFLFLEGRSLTLDTLYRFLASLKLASSSLARTMIALRVFFRFLLRENLLDLDLTPYLETPKVWQLIPEVLTIEEVERLLEAPAADSPLGLRDRAILEVLYGSGLRVSELCALTISDVGDIAVRVLGKGNQERLVPIGRRALEAVDRYLAVRESEAPFLFLTNRGGPCSRTLIWKMVKKRAKQVGIVKNISPHTLRHAFATHLLEGGAELRVIQEMLGHATIATTDRYTHISRQALAQTFHTFHPKG